MEFLNENWKLADPFYIGDSYCAFSGFELLRKDTSTSSASVSILLIGLDERPLMNVSCEL